MAGTETMFGILSVGAEKGRVMEYNIIIYESGTTGPNKFTKVKAFLPEILCKESATEKILRKTTII